MAQKNGSSENPYIHASYIQDLKETKTIALTDLDGTHATRLGTDQEMKDRAEVRAFLKRRSYVAGAVTARTPALTMSSSVYEASRELGFKEPPPLCGFDETDSEGKRRKWVPLEELPFFRQSLDWDLVAGMGSGVWPRNSHGYLLDHEFDNLLNYDSPHHRSQDVERLDDLPWRIAALLFLEMECKWASEHFSDLEVAVNYYERRTIDVAPLPYRIQLGFEGEEGLERMRELKHLISVSANPIARRMAVVDESKPDQGRYTIYLMPYAARKEKMINHLIHRSAEAAKVNPKELRLFYAGDTPTDLKAGLWGGGNTPLTFLLASGSPLTPYVLERRPRYGDEDLDFLSRLKPTSEKGVYTFKVATRPRNTIVIGDERYPGTTPPGSVLKFLHEFAQPHAGH